MGLWLRTFIGCHLLLFPRAGSGGKPDEVLLDGALSARITRLSCLGVQTGGNAMRNLRNLVAACGIDRLIADSKFFPDETLVGFVTAVAAQISRATLGQ